MDKLETIGIKSLRDTLSACIRRVGLGVRILVSDRNKIVAEIVPPGRYSDSPAQKGHPQIQEWVAAGQLSLGSAERTKLTATGVRLTHSSSRELLNLERGET